MEYRLEDSVRYGTVTLASSNLAATSAADPDVTTYCRIVSDGAMVYSCVLSLIHPCASSDNTVSCWSTSLSRSLCSSGCWPRSLSQCLLSSTVDCGGRRCFLGQVLVLPSKMGVSSASTRSGVEWSSESSSDWLEPKLLDFVGEVLWSGSVDFADDDDGGGTRIWCRRWVTSAVEEFSTKK